MKSLVTNRTGVGRRPIGVCGATDAVRRQPHPGHHRHDAVAGERHPQAGDLREASRAAGEAGSQNGVKPLRNACLQLGPVRVRITVRLPNGSTANISPQVISPGCSPGARRGEQEVLAETAGVGEGGVDTRVLRPAWRRSPCCPSPTRSSRVGARRMSATWVPITWFRSTAVWALASSTMACTSARSAHAEVLGDPGGPAGPLDVTALDHQLQHRVAGPGVDALGDEDVAPHQVGDAVRVAHDHGVDRGALELVGDVEDRALPGHAGRGAQGVHAHVRALVDDDHLDLHAELAEPLGLRLDPCGLRRGTLSPAVLPADTSSGVFFSSAPMTPTFTPLIVKTVDGCDPAGRLARGRLHDVRGEEREVGPCLLGLQAGRRRSRTRGCRTTWRRGPRRSRRRWSACPAGATSSVARHRRCHRPRGSGPGPGSAASSSSNIVAR